METDPSEQLSTGSAHPIWTILQWFGLLATVALLAIATEFGLPAAFGILIQLLAFGLVIVWLWKKYSDTGTLRRTA